MSASRICCVVPAGRIGPYDRHTVNDAREGRVNVLIVKRRWVSGNADLVTRFAALGRQLATSRYILAAPSSYLCVTAASVH